ncbi:MAG TPA: hypothetical protein VMA95_12435 [Streptosporangiaceae bacterium]|nr:hypothetical protein [Streptosporangiaceae bacterium]
MFHSSKRLAGAGVIGLILVVLLAGCSISHIKKSIDKVNRENSATGSLESFIQDELTTKFHRSVKSVSCAPYVDEVLQQDTAHMTCKVRFTDGTGYTTQGTVYDPSTDPDYSTYTYSFNDPPGVDLTKAPLPGPILNLPATSPHSLLLARNLTPVVRTLTGHFGSHDLILQMAIYPGEVEAVIAASGGKAWLATATYYNTLKVGPQTSFSGSRSGIAFSQLVPSVIQRLTQEITTKGGAKLADVSRFVLTNNLPSQNSGWNIYLTKGSDRYQALVLGEHLVEFTATGARDLN